SAESSNSTEASATPLSAYQLWQIQYFGSVTNPAAAPTVDADGDGASNQQEFLAGTDPTNPSSVFQITSITPSGNDLLISWSTTLGRTNALQATLGTGYSTNSFTDIFTVTNTTSTTTNYLDLGAVTNSPGRYYRVRLVP